MRRNTTLEQRCAALKARLDLTARLELLAESIPQPQGPAPDLRRPMQRIIATFLRTTRGTKVCTAAPLKMDSTGRERIPDVMVLRREKEDSRHLEDLPTVIVEIKSPDDTFDDLVNLCLDYERLMIFTIVVVDPDNRRAWLFNRGSFRLIEGVAVELPIDQDQTILFPFMDMFSELQRELDVCGDSKDRASKLELYGHERRHASNDD